MLERSTELPFTHGTLSLHLAVSTQGPAGDPSLQLDDFFREAVKLTAAKMPPLYTEVLERFGDLAGTTCVTETFGLSIFAKEVRLTLGAELDQKLDEKLTIALFASTVLPAFFEKVATQVTEHAENDAAEASGLMDQAIDMAMETLAGFFARDGRREAGFSFAGPEHLH